MQSYLNSVVGGFQYYSVNVNPFQGIILEVTNGSLENQKIQPGILYFEILTIN